MLNKTISRISHYELGKKSDRTRRLIDSGNFAQNIKRVVRFTKEEAIKELSNRRSAYLIEVIDHTRLIDNRVEYECEERIINVIER